MIQSDKWIREQSLTNGLIEPFDDQQQKSGVISWGVSSYGYDLRIGHEFKVFDNPVATFKKVIDPKNDSWHSGLTEYKIHRTDTGVIDSFVTIPPNSFALGVSLETLRIPRNILAVCVGKSTYARCGIIVNVTPLEPEWRGKVTIEISNTTPLPAKIYAGEGICQVLFFSAEEKSTVSVPNHLGQSHDRTFAIGQSCERSYAEKSGRYQDQKTLTMPSVNK